MKIVISIPKNLYNAAINGLNPKEIWYLRSAIKNGIQLPKGYGRIIDADVFEKRLMSAREYYIGEKADNFDLRFAAGLKEACLKLVDSPTIIEADGECEEE